MKSSVARAFSRDPEAYHRSASIHREVAAKLLNFIPGSTTPTSILDVGCGTGFLTVSLRERFRNAELTAIDIAPAMIEIARRGDPDTVFVCGDARSYRSPAPVSLIASSSALQWMAPVVQTVQHLAEQLEPRGWLVTATMVRGTFSALSTARREIVPLLSSPVQLPMASDLLRAFGGLSICTSCCETFEEPYDSVEDFLTSIHRLGFTGSTGVVPRMGVRAYRQLKDELTRRNSGPLFVANYEVMFIVARR